MINPYIFREYDIRGVVDKDLTDDVVMQLGKGIGTYMQQHDAKRITIGGDVRLSTERFRVILTQGIRLTGVDVVDLGPVPTPVQYYSMHYLKNVQGGVMITGSHNPPEFNGFKITMHNAPVYGEMIQDIFKIIQSGSFASGRGGFEKIDVTESYMDYIKKNIHLKI